ncbi:MAG: alpha/beta hydrolase [Anaerolineales bacterium]|nr:alpha/beta hydrolase [Anaerolineales bacterium]
MKKKKKAARKKKNLLPIALIVALILIVGGGFLAHFIQTNGGVKVRDLRFMGSDSKLMSALLYVPKGATKATPAPGIVVSHGYINSRETQDGFAIEFARRGYVVLAFDMIGHGYSEPALSTGNFFASGCGGKPALDYLRSLDFVDKANIGLEGHSMAGWGLVTTAMANPNGYRSIVLAGSSTGTYCPPGTPTFPRNLLVVFDKYDEFSKLNWGTPIANDAPKGDKMKAVFGTTAPVEVGKLYGSIEQGTARKLLMPKMEHPMLHWSTEAIGAAVTWMQATLKGGKDIPTSNQIWYWKEIGTLIAMIGMILFLFAIGGYLLKTNYFKVLNEAPAPAKPATGWGWWVGAAVTILLPIPVYLWAWSFNGISGKGGIAKDSWLLPQWNTTTIMFWAVVVAVISLVLLILWHFLANRKKGGSFAAYGFTWKDKGLQLGKVGKSFLLALIAVFAAYLTLVFSAWAFTIDYRIWVFAIKPMSIVHFGIFLRYLIPLAFYFLIIGMVIHGELRRNSSAWAQTAVNILLLIGGYILFFLFQYIPLFAGKTLLLPDVHLPTIVLFQYIPIFIIVGLVSTYFYRKTGHIFVGAFINAMLITWIIVAGTVTNYHF